MSLPAAQLADPFGLWQLPPRAGVSFGAPEESQAPGAVWSVDVLEPGALDARAAQVQAVERGLTAAEDRLDAFLRSRLGTRGGGASFAAPSLAADLPEAERALANALAQSGPGSAYGLPGGLDLDALKSGFEAWMERANRQLLHFVWVDTLAAGQLAARTAVAWNGSVSTTCAFALDPQLLNAHRNSFGLAMNSRVATLRAVVTIASMAGKLSLLIAGPLGPIQALLLAAQFLRQVILPAAQTLMADERPPV